MREIQLITQHICAPPPFLSLLFCFCAAEPDDAAVTHKEAELLNHRLQLKVNCKIPGGKRFFRGISQSCNHQPDALFSGVAEHVETQEVLLLARWKSPCEAAESSQIQLEKLPFEAVSESDHVLRERPNRRCERWHADVDKMTRQKQEVRSGKASSQNNQHPSRRKRQFFGTGFKLANDSGCCNVACFCQNRTTFSSVEEEPRDFSPHLTGFARSLVKLCAASWLNDTVTHV